MDRADHRRRGRRLRAGRRRGTQRLSRSTWEGTARVRPLFLQRGGRGGVGSFMGFAREAEVYRALEPLGIPIPHVWGVDEDLDVFLVDRARQARSGSGRPRDPELAVAVAQDFMHHLAAWHATPAREPRAAQLRPGPFRAGAPASTSWPASRRCSTREDREQPIDLLAAPSSTTCSTTCPTYDGEPVLVQGDTGPGQLHVRRRTRHCDRRLGARAHRRSRWTTSPGCRGGRRSRAGPTSPPGCASTRQRERHRRRRGHACGTTA